MNSSFNLSDYKRPTKRNRNMGRHSLILLMMFVATYSLSTQQSFSSEIDSFTGRYDEFEKLDSYEHSPTDVLNEITNKRLALAVKEANRRGAKKGKECDVRYLYKTVKEQLSGPKFFDVQAVYGVMEGVVDEGGSAESTRKIERRITDRNKSIYQGFNLTEAPLLYTHISSTFAVNHPKYGKLLIGADKLGHFFGQGYSYHLHGKSKGLKSALEWGDRSEKGHMGWTTTGVYSYGDLGANLEGDKFYRRMFQKIGGIGPYVKCVEGQWEINENATFDWLDYFGPWMDEGINCSVYRDNVLSAKVSQQINRLTQADADQNHKYTCPTQNDQCASMIDYYKNFNQEAYVQAAGVNLVEHMVSPACRTAVQYKKSEDHSVPISRANPVREKMCVEKKFYGPFQGPARGFSNAGNLAKFYLKSASDLIKLDKKSVVKNYQQSIQDVQEKIRSTGNAHGIIEKTDVSSDDSSDEEN